MLIHSSESGAVAAGHERAHVLSERNSIRSFSLTSGCTTGHAKMAGRAARWQSRLQPLVKENSIEQPQSPSGSCCVVSHFIERCGLQAQDHSATRCDGAVSAGTVTHCKHFCFADGSYGGKPHRADLAHNQCGDRHN